MVKPGGAQRQVAEELDARELALGKEFQTAECLMNAEVKFLLQAAKDRKLQDDPDAEQSLPLPFQETLLYVTKINRFERATVDQLKSSLQRAVLGDNERPLQSFEIAQLCNLCPGTSEEAKTVIPSLNGFRDEDLQVIVNDVATMQHHQ
eukprot:Unigene6690_Nuclearia_a/m.20533 Unigene6690_Nuclearia_a/g.20533  ORF Unigene6690_Nuclearia_a/g.20533 Unigene6690_Nuclearia_a/m.20533 type:complete len:149 (+) Unigene6690_Nuclearia_a:60-506(+)